MADRETLLVTLGRASTIHEARPWIMNGSFRGHLTLCRMYGLVGDGWMREVDDVPAMPTCKRCLAALAKEATAAAVSVNQKETR